MTDLWQPTNLADLEKIGGLMAKSGFFADSHEAAQAVVKILAGQEMGFGPFASMVGVYVMKGGRLSYAANLIAAAVRRSGRYTYRVRRWDNEGCVLVFLESKRDHTTDYDELGESSFTIDDAKRAGLLAGPNAHNWTHYPRNMLFARALTNGARVYCPDVFGGVAVYTPEELDAPVDAESGNVIEHEPIPQRQPPPSTPPAPEQGMQMNGGEDDPDDDAIPFEGDAPEAELKSVVPNAEWIHSPFEPWWKRYQEVIANAKAAGIADKEVPNLGEPSESHPIARAAVTAAATRLKGLIEAKGEGLPVTAELVGNPNDPTWVKWLATIDEAQSAGITSIPLLQLPVARVNLESADRALRAEVTRRLEGAPT